MKKMRLKPWVEIMLSIWTGIDIGLVLLALYMDRMLEIGL